LNKFVLNNSISNLKPILKEFKEFAMKGNLVDIAVAFVMGAAFKDVVTSFTGGIVSPLIGLIFKADFKDLKYIIQEGVINSKGVLEGESAIMWGNFITHIIDFIIVAFVMFLIIKGINTLKRKEEVEAPSGPSDNQLLSEIRDLLKK
jgi:large conductance mechanosensitive channel